MHIKIRICINTLSLAMTIGRNMCAIISRIFLRENCMPTTRHFNLVHAMVTPFGEPINDNNSTQLPFGIPHFYSAKERPTIISRPIMHRNMFNWHRGFFYRKFVIVQFAIKMIHRYECQLKFRQMESTNHRFLIVTIYPLLYMLIAKSLESIFQL